MQLETVILPTGEQVDPNEWTTTPLYSTVEWQLGVAIQTLPAFSYGLGQPVPVSPAALAQRQSTDADTNMQGAGNILPENERVLLYSIQVELLAVSAGNGDVQATPPDVSLTSLLLCQRDVLCVFWMGSRRKEFCRAKLGYFPGAVGVNRINQPNAQLEGVNDGFLVAYNSGIDPDDARSFASPHDIPGGSPFGFDFQFPIGSVGLNSTSAGTVIRARTGFCGYRKRPVA